MNHVDKKQRTQGFTLIELMLAMTFIAVLLLAIAMTIIQIGAIYNKGITLKDINQAGRSIGDDVKRTTAEAGTITRATDYYTNSAGGRLCLGTYSYIWNTAKALEGNDPNRTTYASTPTKPINFVKVSDAGKIYCARTGGGALTYRTIRAADTTIAQELLPAGDHALGVNLVDLPAASIVTDVTTGQTVYTFLYTLGSGKTSAMDATQSACLGPGQINSDPTYCSVQQFTIVLRTGNRVN